MKRTGVALVAVVVAAGWAYAGNPAGPTVTAPLVGGKEQSILESMHMQQVAKVTAEYSPKGVFTGKEVIEGASSDAEEMKKITQLLSEIPAAGTAQKKFKDEKIEYIRVTVTARDGTTRILMFYNKELRSPNITKGMFYEGEPAKKAKEFLGVVKKIVKRGAPKEIEKNVPPPTM